MGPKRTAKVLDEKSDAKGKKVPPTSGVLQPPGKGKKSATKLKSSEAKQPQPDNEASTGNQDVPKGRRKKPKAPPLTAQQLSLTLRKLEPKSGLSLSDHHAAAFSRTKDHGRAILSNKFPPRGL